MNKHQYRNPPIQEAVCEFRFAPGGDWSLSYPWVFYEKIKETYMGKPREQKLVTLEPAPPGIGGTDRSPFTVIEQSRTQFSMEDNSGLVSIGPDVLSVSILRPYPGWDIFRGRIASALSNYISVAAPSGIRRIGLRYINQITVPGSQVTVADYFNYPPANVLPKECIVDNFMNRNEYIYLDEPIRATQTFARAEAPADISAFLLDIDLTWQWPAEPLSIDTAMSKVDELRRRERFVFEGMVTDRARGVFDVTE